MRRRNSRCMADAMNQSSFQPRRRAFVRKAQQMRQRESLIGDAGTGDRRERGSLDFFTYREVASGLRRRWVISQVSAATTRARLAAPPSRRSRTLMR
jgi:hypothetical protein